MLDLMVVYNALVFSMLQTRINSRFDKRLVVDPPPCHM